MFMPLIFLAAVARQAGDPSTNFILTFPEAAVLFFSQAIGFVAYGTWSQRQHTKQIAEIRAESEQRAEQAEQRARQRAEQAEQRAEQAEQRSRDAEKRMQARLDFVMDFYIRNGSAIARDQSTAVQADSQVLDVLIDRFDLEELQTLAFELGVKWDALPGDSAPTRAMHLVQLMRNNDRMRDLIDAIKRRRQGVFK